MAFDRPAGRTALDRPSLDQLPAPSERRIAVRVHGPAERNLRQGHPWLYESGIRSQSHEGEAGDMAVVFDRKKRFLAVGLYDPASPIRVRILQHGQPTPIDRRFFVDKLTAAANIRESLPATGTDGYRLVHGENDGLPGLVIDRYAGTLVVKLYTWAWAPHLPVLLAACEQALASDRVVLRLGRQAAALMPTAWRLHDGMVLQGEPVSEPVRFRENGLHFLADVLQGQKTGFFLDQRENRSRVERLAAGKRVLNVFAYSGGFSLYAARGGAPTVLSLDVSAPALQAAELNFALNRNDVNVAAARHEILIGDAFEALRRLEELGRRFDMVIIDPPSFAKRQSEIEGALRAYATLARMGLALLLPRGTLVMASCSSRVQADEFFQTIYAAAQNMNRELHEFERSAHALDHPVGFREGAYLKCLFAGVG